jgi:2-dehydro-3-deoxygluconokinase
MTLGENGAYVADGSGGRRVPGVRVPVVDTTGAGDAFTGAYLAEWLRHGDPFAAAAYANAAAALKTLGHGAVAPIPRREAVEAFLNG